MCSSFKSLTNLNRPFYMFHYNTNTITSAYSSCTSLSLRTPPPTSARFCFSQSRRVSSSPSVASMEVLKAVHRQGAAAQDSIAIRADNKSYSYGQLISSARKISNLLNDANFKNTESKHESPSVRNLDGARVGIVAKPSAEFVAGVLGTWFSGGVAVPLALSYPESELLHVMNDSEISLILSTEDQHELMQNIASKCAAQCSLIPSVANVSSQINACDDSEVRGIDAGEIPALIVYTSGTTGKPKGVVHTHRGISAQVQILAEAWGYTSTDKFLHCLPLHHVHGLFNSLLAPLYAGATVEFMKKFSVGGIWQRWRESYPTNGSKADDAITVFTGVPTMYTRLIQGYGAMDAELKASSASAARQLRLMMCGSSALPLPVMEQWETITGHRLLERYGMTEFVMAIANPLRGERKAGTVGKLLPGVQVKIADDESATDATAGGELCIKSPSLFKEYWKLPEVTKESFTHDGFFRTGDAGRMDEDGYYIILGRTSADIMKVGGYKLSALEIESVLLEHSAVAECCVLSLADKDYGEAVCAIIVPEAEAKTRRQKESKPVITLEELSSWAKEKLAPYKLPTKLLVWDSLPRNAMGKVNKKELKKSLAGQQ
ncbi:malonate--CoA ligase-like isoform X2 [Tripterygium wilfordii]|uniref:malonate--CoA ligase-like isoform X2 n=1 Tax=Tripterygium wilfordii TaxID=458696 RepID=UPI0018F8217A|nr:malonate--CoA ligase-like isoform X2 [Tripterygium wilfordii]